MSLIPFRTKRKEETEVSPLSGFRWEMDRLFDAFLRDAFHWDDENERAGAWGPPLDVEETDKEVFVRAEIPGVKLEDLKLSIVGNALSIAGEKTESAEHREGGYFHHERRFGAFRREVPLPASVDTADVHAEFKDGVLQVRLTKSEEVLPKKIPVHSA